MMLNQMFQFNNGQAEKVVQLEKMEIHRDIFVIARSEEEARIKSARKMDNGYLPESYVLLKTFTLSRYWQVGEKK